MNDLCTYDSVKKDMKSGDALLYKSRSLLGWLIRLFSKDFNHAGLVVQLDMYQGQECRRWTLEALQHGVVLNFLSRRLQEVDGECWWYPLKEEYNGQREKVGEYALAQSGQPYDYDSLFKNILGRVSVNARELFCSELAFLSWRFAGIVIGEVAPRPGDIPKLNIFKEPIRII
jgi:hypothetical protein